MRGLISTTSGAKSMRSLVFALALWSVGSIQADQAVEILRSVYFVPGVELPFTQTHVSPLLRREVVQHGRLSYEADVLRMLFTTPRWEERTFSGYALTLRREVQGRQRTGKQIVSRTTQLDLEQPQHLALFALQTVLRGNIDALQSHFQAADVSQTLPADAAPQSWQVHLTPLDPTHRSVMPKLELYGEGQRLKRFRSERLNKSGIATHYIQVDIHSSPALEAEPHNPETRGRS